MKNIFLIGLALILLILQSCKKEEVKELPEGTIYLRITSDVSITSYDDDNDGLPNGFTAGTYYQCSEGTYTYSAKIGNYTWTAKTYELSTPTAGFRRNYTLNFYNNTSTGGMSAKVTSVDVEQ